MINWTEIGIKGISIKYIDWAETSYYFPVYGPFNLIYTLHIASLLFCLIVIFLLSKTTQNKYTKDFFRNFALYSILFLISGFINFFPGTGAILSSLAVVLFSVMITTSFLKMNLHITLKYKELSERQKKLDFTGNLVGSLVHEVHNNTQVIKGFNQLLNSSTTMNQSDREKVEYIHKAVNQMEELTNNYKEYIKSSSIGFKKENLNQIIQDSIDFSKTLVNQDNLNIVFSTKYPILLAYVNRSYIQQVFINLIKNSAEAQSREISIETDIEKESLFVHIKDTGHGIPVSDWQNIFDPFVSTKGSGMGMGLPFVKKILFEHRGDIKIMNSSINGTHFRIELPQNDLIDL
ncbi:sensor histidine kinase [Robertmurraya mangrovi]|nr:ATP-binding protein [Bacillus sp. 31A1R]